MMNPEKRPTVKTGWHKPNHIPRRHRIAYIILSAILLAYGTFGLYINDIYIPGKRSSGAHYKGEAALIMYLAFVATVANLLSIVIDHYDKRSNETNYRAFARITHTLAWSFFFLAIFWSLITGRNQ